MNCGPGVMEYLTVIRFFQPSLKEAPTLTRKYPLLNKNASILFWLCRIAAVSNTATGSPHCIKRFPFSIFLLMASTLFCFRYCRLAILRWFLVEAIFLSNFL